MTPVVSTVLRFLAVCSLCALLFLLLQSPQARGMEFEPYDSFRSYESPQLQPFSTMPPFEEEPLEPIGPGPQPPDVQMPAYEESPYGEIQPPERPNVQVEDKRFRNYKGFRPMTPIEEGSIRPMKPFDFEPYKPIGQGGE